MFSILTCAYFHNFHQLLSGTEYGPLHFGVLFTNWKTNFMCPPPLSTINFARYIVILAIIYYCGAYLSCFIPTMVSKSLHRKCHLFCELNHFVHWMHSQPHISHVLNVIKGPLAFLHCCHLCFQSLAQWVTVWFLLVTVMGASPCSFLHYRIIVSNVGLFAGSLATS